jgi:hypothetical protein
MAKKLFLISLVVLAFSVTAFAGEGSDTIGACRLLPELRYAYYETPMRVTLHPESSVALPSYDDDWRLKEHDVTLQVTYGLTDNIDLYTFLGARLGAEKTGSSSIMIGTVRTPQDNLFDLDSGFICGAGIRGTFYRWPNGLYLGGGLSLTYAVTDNHRPLKQRGPGGSYTDTGLRFRDTDYAVAADLHAGWHIGDTGLTPYLGVEYRYELEYLYAYKQGDGNYVNDHRMESKNPVGVVVGLDYLLNDRLYFNVETQMVKRWGGSFSVGYMFDLCAVPVVPAVVPEAPVPAPQLVPMSMK